MSASPEIVGPALSTPAPPPPHGPDEGRVAYTISDFAKRLSISESFVWKLLAEKRLAAVKIGRRTLIPHTELVRLMQASAL